MAGKCKTKHCRNTPRKRPERKSPGLYCYKCESRRLKEINFFRYYYNVTKQNAKRRGKPFSLTFEEYKGFTVGAGMIDPLTGKKDPFKTLDRREDDKGYSLENLQVLTLAQNSRKRWVDYYNTGEGAAELDDEGRAYWEHKQKELQREIDEDLPF